MPCFCVVSGANSGHILQHIILLFAAIIIISNIIVISLILHYITSHYNDDNDSNNTNENNKNNKNNKEHPTNKHPSKLEPALPQVGNYGLKYHQTIILCR
eukprot:2723180-Amphidinium_carterae.2